MKNKLYKLKIWLLMKVFRRKYTISFDYADKDCPENNDYSVVLLWRIHKDGSKTLVNKEIL